MIGREGSALLRISPRSRLLSQTVTVELKNDLQVKGTLMSVDQYLNIKLDNTSVRQPFAFRARRGSHPPT